MGDLIDACEWDGNQEQQRGKSDVPLAVSLVCSFMGTSSVQFLELVVLISINLD